MADEHMRLSIDSVERILSRALLSGEDPGGSLSLADLRRIAAELEIPVSAVDAALVAELARESDERRLARIVPGQTVEVRRTIAGGEPEVRARARRWLARHEGLRLRRVDGPLELWERDPSLLASARSMLNLHGGSGRLRDTKGVRMAISGDDTDTHVSLSVRSIAPQGATYGTIAGFGVVGATLAVFLQGWAWAYILLPMLVLGVVIGATIGRAVFADLARGVERSLDGIEQGAMAPEDSVAEVFSDLRGAVRRRARPTEQRRDGIEL